MDNISWIGDGKMQKGKIVNCSNDVMWYKDKIGESYDVLFVDDNGDVVVDLTNELGQRGSVLPTDIEIIEEESV